MEVAGSQRLYEDLVESLDGIVWEINASDFRFTFVSKQSERILGYSPERWLAELTWQDLVHPEDIDHVLTTCGKAIEEGRNHDLEYRMIAADGRVVWIRDIATVVVDGDRPRKVRGALLDITERKRAEEALRESEERFRSAFEHAAIGMALVRPDGHLLRVNPSFCRLLGYSGEELVSTTWQAITHPDDLGIGDDHMRRMLSGEIDSCQFEKRYLHKRGHVVWALLSFSLVRDVAERPLHFITQIQDITERRRAEEAMRDSEERLKILFESAPDAYYLNDLEGRFVDGNRAAGEISGYKREELIGQSFLSLKLLSPDEISKAAVLLARNAQGEATGPDEFTLNRKDGSQVTVEIRTFVVRITGEVLVLSIARDISERKRMGEALQVAREELEGKVERQMLRRNPYGLTFRELTVLHKVAAGESDRQVGITLGISHLTAQKHVSNILAKMEAASRTEAAARALREGLLD